MTPFRPSKSGYVTTSTPALVSGQTCYPGARLDRHAILRDSVADTQSQARSQYVEVINANLGRAVRALRGQASLTQGQLADHVGLSRASIANIERGDQAVTVPLLLRLANALNVPAERLLDGARANATDVDEPLAEYADHLDDQELDWLRSLLPQRNEPTPA
jgi:transcriptional regulator with XRE-family HTH domain